MSKLADLGNVNMWCSMGAVASYRARNLARGYGISLRHLQRHFRSNLGRTPQDWLNEQRMIAAPLVLLRSESIKRASFDLGFKQPAHFCRHFKMYYGMSPSEFVSAERARQADGSAVGLLEVAGI